MKFLLALPFIGLLWVPFYNQETPALFGSRIEWTFTAREPLYIFSCLPPTTSLASVSRCS